MKVKYLILILGLILSGCSTSYHINKAKDKCPECFELDTTINEIVFMMDTVIRIDTNILIFLPDDTVFIDTSLKKLKPYSFKPIYAKNGIINVVVSMKRGILHVRSYLDSAMIYNLKADILIKDALITKLRTINTNQTVIIEDQSKELKWYQKALKTGRYILIGIVLLLLGGIIYKIYKVFYKK